MDWEEFGGSRLSPPITHDGPHCPAPRRARGQAQGPGVPHSPGGAGMLEARHRHASAPQNTGDQERGPLQCPQHAGSRCSCCFCSWKGVQASWGAVGGPCPVPGWTWLMAYGGSHDQFEILPPRNSENRFTEQNKDVEMSFRHEMRASYWARVCFIRATSSALNQIEGGCGSSWASFSHSPLRGPHQRGSHHTKVPSTETPIACWVGSDEAGDAAPPACALRPPTAPGPRCPARGPALLPIHSASLAPSRGYV